MWRGAAGPNSALSICVVLPVRNEAANLADTLAALARQRTFSGTAFDRSRFEVLVLANNCHDQSARVAADFSRAQPDLALHVEEVTLPVADAHIGHVRKLLMDAACERLGRAGAMNGIVASTDGDSVVGESWLAALQHEFELGVAAVGGRIVLDPKGPIEPHTLRRQRCDTAYNLAQARLEHLLDPDPADPWPRHHQHFGANLAVRRDAYLTVGGIPEVRYLEDEALVTALRRADLCVRHSPLARVRTSARPDGRVEVGLSWQLRQWAEFRGEHQPMLVADPDVFVTSIQARRLLRQAWRTRTESRLTVAANAVAACFNVPPLHLTDLARRSATFGALWDEVQALGGRAAAPPTMPVRQAIDRLRVLIRIHSTRACAHSNTSSR